MEAVFIQDGESIDYTPGADVAAGEVIVQGDLVGVALEPIASGRPGALKIKGVFDVAKGTGAGTDSTVGTPYYFDASNNIATEDDNSGANKLMGVSVKAAGTADTTVRILLKQL